MAKSNAPNIEPMRKPATGDLEYSGLAMASVWEI